MKQAIVFTTINQPTIAVKKFRELTDPDTIIVVVGDKKTPSNWHLQGVEFLATDRQEMLYPKFSKLVPFNHYARKNIGYLHAINLGATTILDTDDDNIPYDSWKFDQYRKQSRFEASFNGFANVYSIFSNDLIWPRGLPLENIYNKPRLLEQSQESTNPIRQHLADLDPDVDSIYRLIFKKSITFEQNSYSIVLGSNCHSPFNSQNTYFDIESFPLLYLPSFVSFRMTDIWRSFVALKICKLLNWKISFSNADVYQDRNQHNLVKDFEDEIPGFLNNKRILEILDSLIIDKLQPSDLMLQYYRELVSHNIIEQQEIALLEVWLENFS